MKIILIIRVLLLVIVSVIFFPLAWAIYGIAIVMSWISDQVLARGLVAVLTALENERASLDEAMRNNGSSR